MVNRIAHRQYGLGLLEMTIAIVISTIIFLSLSGLISLAFLSAKTGHAVNELRYIASFAFDRIADSARAQAQRPLSVPPINSTGDLFAPAGCSGSACVMFCLNTSNRKLIETVVSDSGCNGTGVIASNVSSFNVALPAMGPLDRHSVIITVGLDDLSGATLVQSMQIRTGGGLK